MEGSGRLVELDCETVNAKIYYIFQLFFQRFALHFLLAMKTMIFAFTVCQSGWTMHFLMDFSTLSGALGDHFQRVLVAIGAFLRPIGRRGTVRCAISEVRF